MRDFDELELETTAASLFTRSGHLTELSLDRFAAGELPTELHEAVVEHLESCEHCSNLWQAMSMQADGLELQPPATLETDATGSGRIATGLFGLTAVMVAAAALLLIFLPQPQEASRDHDTQTTLMASPYTSTSAEYELATVTGGMDVSVVLDSDGGEALEEGARVSVDEDVEVRLKAKDPHFAAVVLLTDDDADDEEGTGGMVDADVDLLVPVTRFLRGDTKAVSLDPPLRRDTEFGQQVVVIMCQERFSVVTRDDVEAVEAAPGCRRFELGLRRFAEIADS